jgi:hypothetical protein
MQNFKDKLYNYESAPPENIWNNIVTELDTDKSDVVHITGFRKRSKIIFYSLTAAASLIIIFLSSLFFNRNKDNDTTRMASISNPDSVVKQQLNDSINNETLASIIQSSKNNPPLSEIYSTPHTAKKYITIAGPEGQPVKISSKVATLIVSADNDYPPKPVWDKKITKWKEIMLSSTISPTATNLLDIVQLSSITGDN